MLLLQLRKGIKCNGESNIYSINVKIILCADCARLTLLRVWMMQHHGGPFLRKARRSSKSRQWA